MEQMIAGYILFRIVELFIVKAFYFFINER